MYANFKQRGFTLIEIMIVVLLLSIIVVLVAPVVSGAGADARKAGLSEQLRIVRTQIQLFMMQHGDAPPALTGNDWDDLVTPTLYEGKNCGPYLPEAPRNSLNNLSAISVVNVDPNFGDPVAQPGIGFVYNSLTGNIWATNTAADRIFDENNLQNPAN